MNKNQLCNTIILRPTEAIANVDEISAMIEQNKKLWSLYKGKPNEYFVKLNIDNRVRYQIQGKGK